MTCGDKFNKNCPTYGSRVDPAEVDGRATCDRPGCGKKLRGDGRCVDGHVQGEPPVMADLDGLLDLFDELRIDDDSYEMAAPVVYARYVVAVAREGPEVVRTGWVYRNRGASGRQLEDQSLVWADTQEEAVAQANELGCAGDHWELTPLAEYMPQHYDPSFGPLCGTPQELGAAAVRALLAVIADAQNDDLWHDPRAVAARDRSVAPPSAGAAIAHRDWNPTGDSMEQMLAEGGGELPHERAGYPIIYTTAGGNQLCSLCAMADLLQPADKETYGVAGYRLLDEPEAVTYCDECQHEFSYPGGEEGAAEEGPTRGVPAASAAAPRLCIRDGCGAVVNPVTARCANGHVQFYADDELWDSAPSAGGGMETTVDFTRFELHTTGVDDDQQRHNSRQAISSYLRLCLKEMTEGDALALSRAKELVDLMRQRIPHAEQNMPRHLRQWCARVDARVQAVRPGDGPEPPAVRYVRARLAENDLLQADGSVVVTDRESSELFWENIASAAGNHLNTEGTRFGEYEVTTNADGNTQVTQWVYFENTPGQLHASQRVIVYEAQMPRRERWSAQEIAVQVESMRQQMQTRIDKLRRTQ